MRNKRGPKRSEPTATHSDDRRVGRWLLAMDVLDTTLTQIYSLLPHPPTAKPVSRVDVDWFGFPVPDIDDLCWDVDTGLSGTMEVTDACVEACMGVIFSKAQLRHTSQKDWTRMLAQGSFTATELAALKRMRRREKACVYAETRRQHKLHEQASVVDELKALRAENARLWAENSELRCQHRQKIAGHMHATEA